jgi:tetratricopeptide (TPR) repeat protein
VRVNALADGPPLRSESERARWREYLGARYHRAHRYREAVAEFAQAAALAPSPTILAAWGMAARWAGDEDSEERAFTMVLQRVPADRIAVRVAALTGLARIALERGDRLKAAELVSQAITLDPQSEDAQALARRIAAGAP